jgi:hypothetical protein
MMESDEESTEIRIKAAAADMRISGERMHK